MRKDLFKNLVINLIWVTFFCLFSYIFPKNKKLVVFGSGFGIKFMGNPKYFYLWLLKEKKKDFNFYWITRNKKVYKNLHEKKMPVAFLYSLKGIYLVLRAYLFVVEQSSKDIVGTAFILGKYKILNTLHGTPIKDLSIDEQVKERGLIDLVFKLGITMERKKYTMIACADEIALKLKFSLHNKNIKVTGYPRDDIFFDKKLSFVDYVEQFKLNKYKKIMLFAPTQRDRGGLGAPFTRKFLVELNEYLAEKNYLFLIRTHPLAKDKIDISNLKNILDITYGADDIQEILIHTDILVVDYSSLIFDFALSKKSIIFYPFDYMDYIAHSRNMYFDYYKEMPGPFANNEKELLSLIEAEDVWSKEKDYKKKYEEFNGRFNKYQDGKSSGRLYKLLNSLI